MKNKKALGLSLAAVFTVAASPAQAPQQAPRTPILNGSETSYWKPASVDAIIALHRCPETTACGEIYWYNPRDKRVAGNFGDPHLPKGTPQDFCGFSPRMNFREVSVNKWRGTMNVRGRNITVRMDIDAVDADTIRLTGYLDPLTRMIYSKKDTWHRVDIPDARYPACKK